jgi:hypothetical protein
MSIKEEAMTEHHRNALVRLITIAQSDTGQGRRVANFLLAWWNAEECGGFDLTDLWSVDVNIAADMVDVFAFVAGRRHYPDDLGYKEQFQSIFNEWRPAS